VDHGSFRPDGQPTADAGDTGQELDHHGLDVEDVPHVRAVEEPGDLRNPRPAGTRPQVLKHAHPVTSLLMCYSLPLKGNIVYCHFLQYLFRSGNCDLLIGRFKLNLNDIHIHILVHNFTQYILPYRTKLRISAINQAFSILKHKNC